MKISHLLIVLREPGVSPESLSAKAGISNMTIRRWMRRPPASELPKVYARAIEDAVHELVAEGTLKADGGAARAVCGEIEPRFEAVVRTLGLHRGFLERGDDVDDRRLLDGISEIGSDAERRRYVDRRIGLTGRYEKMGAEWRRRIGVLKTAVESKTADLFSKSVAYGSFFYLFCIQDFIPDYVPVVGALDDFAVLGLAAAFLLKKIR